MLKIVRGRVLWDVMMVMMLPTAFHNSHAGYNTQDINFGRFFKAATQTSKRLLKEVFLMMLYRSYVSTMNCSTTVAEYCFSVLSWSNRQYRDSFNAEERTLLEQPLTTTDFDVTLLTKMIHKLFPSMHLPESFLRALRELKNVRNRVCHEHLVLDQAQLRNNFDDLKLIFQNLLREAADFLSVEVDDLLDVCYLEVEEILASPVTAEASEYFEKVQQFRAYLVGKFITYGRQELMTLYSKLKILQPFTWLNDDQFQDMLIEKIFSPLHITEQSRCVDVFSLLTTESICHERQEATGILPSVLVLSGIAGCGKTSLCRYFLHDWRTRSGGIAGLQSVDILIHIEVRNVACSSLLPYLQRTLLQETCKCFEEKDIIITLQQMNVLYVIDGMDEAMIANSQLVNEVLSVLGTSRAIITTRPECTPAITQAVQRYHLTRMNLCIQGFSDEAMIKYTSKVFSSLETDEQQRHQQECEFLIFLEKARSGLGDHLKLPLTLVLLINLWREDKSRLTQVTSTTRLYFEIFRMCTMKLISRLQTLTLLHQVDLEACIEEWLLALGKEAYNMLANGEYVINDNGRKMLMSLCTARQIDSIQVLSAFLTCELKESFRGIQYLFSFIHKSQMEYLAAMYLAHRVSMEFHSRPQVPVVPILMQKLNIAEIGVQGNKMLNRNPELVMFHSMGVYKWNNTLKFVIGHLCMNNSSELIVREVMEKLSKIRSYSYDVSALWQIVQESDCHPIVCEIVSLMIHKDYVWQPKNEDLCSPSDPLFMLLQHTNFTPKKVIIRIPDNARQIIVPTKKGYVKRKKYENLVLILACLAQRPSVEVVLRMDQDYYSWGSPDVTDDLLTTLLPTANLKSFMGHVGVCGAAALATVREISEVYIRVTDPAALHVLGDWLSAARGKVIKMTLRLDIPSCVSPSSLPMFSHTPDLSIILRDVDDEHAVWAGEVLAHLSCSYRNVDVVASTLTPPEGHRFLRILKVREVGISERLTILSIHRLEESDYEQMCEIIQCSFAWWY